MKFVLNLKEITRAYHLSLQLMTRPGAKLLQQSEIKAYANYLSNITEK